MTTTRSIWYLVGILLLLSELAFSQGNLVLDPGFEQLEVKEENLTKLARNPSSKNRWWVSGKKGPVIFSNPEAYVAKPSSGKNALAMPLGGWEYQRKTSFVTGELSTPLQRGTKYCVCADLVLHRTSKWAGTDIGWMLHRDKDLIGTINDPATITATVYVNDGKPVTNTKWQEYCSEYVASGGERYISFGKFGKSASVSLKQLGQEAYPEADGYDRQAFYQIDHFSVTPSETGRACGCAEPLRSVEEVELPPFLFALDVSNSMNKRGLFDTLRNELSAFVERLPDGSAVSFVTFASDAQLLYQGEKEAWTAKHVYDKLDNTPVKGTTKPMTGLEKAYASMPTDEPDGARLVFISDGRYEVTDEMVNLVRAQYEQYGRKLVLFQIGSRAIGLSQLDPYLDSYFHVTAPEVSQVVSSLAQLSLHGLPAVACPCTDTLPEPVDYHFVIDYSYSMLDEHPISLKGLHYLFTMVQDSSYFSLTLFNHEATPLFEGYKSALSIDSLDDLLRSRTVLGGTKPDHGVNEALRVVKRRGVGRRNVIVMLTDRASVELSTNSKLRNALGASSSDGRLTTGVFQFYQPDPASNKVSIMNALFDPVSTSFYTVRKTRFEKALFNVDRSFCDYNSQPHHQGKVRGFVTNFLHEVQREWEQGEYEFLMQQREEH